jgi:hypothetical protein
MVFNMESSPFQSSPFNASEGNSSPRLFWQVRDPTTPNRFNSENLFAGRETSPSPTRRSSIERLQKASRVKNSNMFAREQKQEYDPTSVPLVERPLAKQLQGNAYGGSGLDGLRSAERGRPFSHSRTDSKSSIPLYNPASPPKIPLKDGVNGQRSPTKDQVSPMKSSLSSSRFNGKASYDSENGTWSDEPSTDEHQLPPGRKLHRHAKSVTFDAAPPQINEYEMTTPDLSSIGTGSRENSYDSGEEDEDDSYNRGDSIEQDDSFDASLEDTDKTPVVGPEDWRHSSPGEHNSSFMSGGFEDPFDGPEGSPMPDARPSSSIGRPTASRCDSLNSNGEHRPLPPLPGMDLHRRSGSSSSVGLTAAAERATNSQRNLPSPPAPSPISKSEVQSMTGGKMSLEERLRLMMIQDDEKPKTEAEKQRERRMRRAGPRERNSHTPEPERTISIHEDEDTLDDLPGLGDYQLPPRISRESILRKVNGQDPFSRESDYNFSSPMPSSSPERPVPLDPDTPLPSTEDSMMDYDDSVIIKREPDEEDELDVYAIPDMYQGDEARGEVYNNTQDSENGIATPEPVSKEEDDESTSHYSEPVLQSQSPQLQCQVSNENEGPPTPRAASPKPQEEFLDPVKQDNGRSLPEFTGFLSNNDFGLSLQSYMTPSPPPTNDEQKTAAPKMAQAQEYLQRPETPQERQMPSSRPEYDGSGWGPEEEDEFDVGTPDSVIRHPISPSPTPEEEAPELPARDSPSIPEQVATIKASGSKLKTRPSATPADIMAMRDLRRQVSGETRSIPPIPERHRNRPLSVERELGDTEESGEYLERHPSFKKRSLTLDIGGGLGLSLDQDFDRVIEAQKVAFTLSSSQSVIIGHDRQASSTSQFALSETYANLTPGKQRGYLMRQNTKLVVATSNDDMADGFHGTRSAGNSPVKQNRPQSWTVEPWNGQARKSSLHDRSNPRKKPTSGPVPPMPGHGSNATGLGILAEDMASDPVSEEGGERGRLFVKVIGVKDLDLPLPKSKYPGNMG